MAHAHTHTRMHARIPLDATTWRHVAPGHLVCGRAGSGPDPGGDARESAGARVALGGLPGLPAGRHDSPAAVLEGEARYALHAGEARRMGWSREWGGGRGEGAGGRGEGRQGGGGAGGEGRQGEGRQSLRRASSGHGGKAKRGKARWKAALRQAPSAHTDPTLPPSLHSLLATRRLCCLCCGVRPCPSSLVLAPR